MTTTQQPAHPLDTWQKSPAFPAAEFASRQQAVAERARAEELSLLVITDPRSICYLTGYDAHSYYIPQALLLSVEDAEPLLVLRNMDISCAEWLTHLSSDQMVGYPDRYVSGFDHPFAFIAETIRGRGWHHGRIGVVNDSFGLTPAGLNALAVGLPGMELQDMGLIIEWERTIKSPLELDAIRAAGHISDSAMSAAIQATESGVSELEVASRIHQALAKGVPGSPSSDVFYPAMGNGPRTAAPHLGWFDDVYRDGYPAMFELGGVHKGYAAGISRTVFLGDPPAGFMKFSDLAEDGLEAALQHLRAGERVSSVERAWSEITKPHGYDKRARIGYSIGIAMPGVGWIDGTVSVTNDDHTVLQPGMVIHMMLAMWEKPVGYALSETFIVSEGAPESVSTLPRSLTVKG